MPSLQQQLIEIMVMPFKLIISICLWVGFVALVGYLLTAFKTFMRRR